MRKFTFLFIGFFLTCEVKSQHSKIITGLDLQPSISSIVGSDGVRKSLTGGLNFEYLITNILSVKSGIYYDHKGTNIHRTTLYPMYTYWYDLKKNIDYLSFPLLLSISTKTKVQIFINTGPVFSILLNEKEISSQRNIAGTNTVDNSNLYNKTDIGWAIGSGLSIPLNRKILLSFELRNDFGLTNMFKSYVYSSDKERSNFLSILVGLKYRI